MVTKATVSSQLLTALLCCQNKDSNMELCRSVYKFTLTPGRGVSLGNCNKAGSLGKEGVGWEEGEGGEDRQVGGLNSLSAPSLVCSFFCCLLLRQRTHSGHQGFGLVKV